MATSPPTATATTSSIWKDDTRTSEWLRFGYPRQNKEPFLCIADFFRPVESGELDYAGFHIVTMGGPRPSELTAELFAENRYQEYLLLHGLGVEMAEALAEYWHRRIREEWGFADEDGPSIAGLFRQQYRGGRYSWGYPACPDLEDNAEGGGAARRADASVSRSARRPGASTSPSRRRAPSSVITRKPSTSSPADALTPTSQAAVLCSRASASDSCKIRRASATPLRPRAAWSRRAATVRRCGTRARRADVPWIQYAEGCDIPGRDVGHGPATSRHEALLWPIRGTLGGA